MRDNSGWQRRRIPKVVGSRPDPSPAVSGDQRLRRHDPMLLLGQCPTGRMGSADSPSEEVAINTASVTRPEDDGRNAGVVPEGDRRAGRLRYGSGNVSDGAHSCAIALLRAMNMPTTYQDLLTRTRALIATSSRVPVVGISGHGGSGKVDPG